MKLLQIEYLYLQNIFFHVKNIISNIKCYFAYSCILMYNALVPMEKVSWYFWECIIIKDPFMITLKNLQRKCIWNIFVSFCDG